MSSHGTRNWNDIAAAARDLADVADACTGEGAHRLRGPTERLRKLLSTVDASRDEPTEADPLEWPEGVVGPDAVAAVADAGPKSVKLLAESHELLRQMAAQNAALYNQAAISCIEAESEVKELRALVGGRSAAPTREQIDEAIADALRECIAYSDGVAGSDSHEQISMDAERSFVHELIRDGTLTDAVVALLSRSAAGPPDAERTLAEARSLMRTARSLDPVNATSNELLGQLYGDLIELLAPDDGVAAEPNEGHGDGA